ncbi:MAG: hypothetical protein ACKVZH_19350 [Blastocatellia bacterium]
MQSTNDLIATFKKARVLKPIGLAAVCLLFLPFVLKSDTGGLGAGARNRQPNAASQPDLVCKYIKKRGVA